MTPSRLDNAHNDSSSDLVEIGYLTKAHGIRGELVFVLTADSPELVQGKLFVRPKNGGAVRTLSVLRTRRHHGSFLILFEGVVTRNDAELLRSHTVFVPKDRLPPLDEDEIYLDDLIGLAVYVAEDGKAERLLGTIREADAPAGQILWSIETPEGAEVLFPAVPEFVHSIDLERRVACIAPPPGLLDMYLAGE